LKYVEKTINYTTDWSAESATNGVVVMNMLPKDHIYAIQAYSIYVSYEIQEYMYVVDTHIHVVEHACRINHICCITQYVVEHNMLISIICS